MVKNKKQDMSSVKIAVFQLLEGEQIDGIPFF